MVLEAKTSTSLFSLGVMSFIDFFQGITEVSYFYFVRDANPSNSRASGHSLKGIYEHA